MAPRYVMAATFWQRMRGLLGNGGARLSSGQELVIVPCARIHTFGLKRPIDVAFADKTGRVLRAVRSLGPGRVVGCPRACLVLERFAAPAEIPWYEAGDSVDVALL